MPFRLTNAPSTFQALMNDIFRKYLRHFVLVFFDDILVYSRNREEHQLHLKKVLGVLKGQQLYVNLTKCCFGQERLEYLGHVISANGVEVDQLKIEAMLKWPVPKKYQGGEGISRAYRTLSEICIRVWKNSLGFDRAI